MREGSVSVVYTYGREVDGVFCDALMAFACVPKYSWRVFDPERGGGVMSFSGTRIAHNRNELVRQFLAGPAEWCMMIDTDHSFALDAIDRLIAAAKSKQAPEAPGAGKIMGGLCFAGGRSGIMSPTMYRMVGTNPDDAEVRVIDDWRAGEILEVTATGAAFLLVHRDVLQAMADAFADRHPYEWFGEGLHRSTNGDRPGVEFGEDFFFCISARRLGFPAFVHTGVEAPHMKSWVLSSLEWKRYREQRERFGEDAIKAQAFQLRCGVVETLEQVYGPPWQDGRENPMNRAERRRAERANAR